MQRSRRAFFRHGVACALLATVASAQVLPPPSPATPPADKAKDEALKLEDFVVTGVFNATEVRQATTAITTLSQDLLSTQVPISAGTGSSTSPAST